MIFVTSSYDVAGLSQRQTRLSLHEFNMFLKEIRAINADHADEPYMLQVALESSLRRHGVDLRKVLPANLLGQIDDIDRALRLDRVAAAENLVDLLSNSSYNPMVLFSEDDPEMWEFELLHNGDNKVELTDDSYHLKTTAMTGAVVRLVEHLQIDGSGLSEKISALLDSIAEITSPGEMPSDLTDRLPVQFANVSTYLFTALDDQDAQTATKVRDRLLNKSGEMPQRWRYTGLVEREDGFYEAEISWHSTGRSRGRAYWGRPARSLYTAMIGAAMMAYAYEIEMGQLPK